MGARARRPREVRGRRTRGLRGSSPRLPGAHRLEVVLNALARHVALVGFMGAGKSTLGPALAARLGRPFVSVDALVEERAETSVAELFRTRGEAEFRALEEETAAEVLGRRLPALVELGGGALGAERTRASLRDSAFTVLVETSVDEAWKRVEGSSRPLARDRGAFQALFAEREPLYEQVADAGANDVDGAVLAAAGIVVEEGAIARLDELIPLAAPSALVADETVARLHGEKARAALGSRLAEYHEVPAGEAAKSATEAERLWSALRLERAGAVAALGGGSTLDLAGFVAATYLRGLHWIALPTTLVSQVDAAIGGKTAIDLAEGKNLVGAFHWPARVIVDPRMLETLPPEERRNGLAEVVKTGLLAGDAVWELETVEQVRRCAAFKAGVCLRDPFDRGERAQLNLGHTFAHALEAASGYRLSHGQAVALGLLAALRVSGLEQETQMVEDVLGPEPVRVDPEAAWAALARDKKAEGGVPRLVLLDAPGSPRLGVELPPAEVRAALESVIA